MLETVYFRFRYSFICQSISTRRQRRTLIAVFETKLLPVTTSLTNRYSKEEAISLSALPKGQVQLFFNAGCNEQVFYPKPWKKLAHLSYCFREICKFRKM